MRKKVFFSIIIIYTILAFSTVITKGDDRDSASNDNDFTASGSYNESIEWELRNGVLIISGTGSINPERRVWVGGVMGWYDYIYPWSDYAGSTTEVVIKEGITSIGIEAFSGFHDMKEITFPQSLAYIERDAFWGCKSITSLIIPEGVTSIENRTFSGCNALKNVVLPDSITSIGRRAFASCANLININIPDSVVDIGEEAFAFCTSLTTISIPDSIVEIGNHAFSGCTSLIDVNVNKNVAGNKKVEENIAAIGSRAFEDCTSLKTVYVPSGVSKIKASAFCDCGELSEIFVSSNLTEVESKAFDRCYKLSDIYYAGSEEQWEKIRILKEDNGIDYNRYLRGAYVHYDSVSKEDAELEKDRFGLAVGKSFMLPGIDETEVSYKSENTSIVKVVNKKTGKIRAVAEGSTRIMLYYTDTSGEKQMAYYRVYVTNPTCAVSAQDQVVGSFYRVKISGISPFSKITIESKDESILQVTGDDEYEVKKYGSTELIIRVDGKILKQKIETIDPFLEKWEMILVAGESKKLKLEGVWENTSIAYKSYDSAVATISKKGKITAKEEGGTVIAAWVGNRLFYCTIIVVPALNTGVKVVKKGESKLGAAYSQEKRMQEGYYDCSSFVWRIYREAGVNLGGFKTAPSAAELAKKLEAQNKVIAYGALKPEELQAGDIIFYSYGKNGRYKNISHVSIYYGTYRGMESFYLKDKNDLCGLVIDAMPFYGGVNIHEYFMEKSIVMIVRP